MELTIGKHKLVGSLAQIAKPLVLLEKKQAGDDSAGEMEFVVKGIIRSKYVFKSRPILALGKRKL